jgi:DNA-binding CsgD family transcriptional regulator
MLVGRAQELSTLVAAADRAAAGEGRVAVVLGEPGIGKTALLRETCAHAERAGLRVLAGRAAEHEHDVPFGLIVDALDDHVAALGARRVESLGVDAELAAVFPALGAGAAVTSERWRYHRAIRALVDMLGRERPVALVLDDLHWADDASVELVLHLLHRPPRSPHLLVLALRPSGPVTRLLDAVRAVPADRIELGRLSDGASRELLRDVEAPARERACREGAGNPLFLLELARGDADLPPTVVAVVERELAGLPEAARTLARGAAVAGDPFTPELAATAAGLDGVAALDALAASGLVVAGRRSWSFRHPLVRSAIYDGAPAGWRIEAHARAAAALAGAPPVVRAYHVEQSARPGDEQAVAVLRAAAEASAPRSPATAVHWWRSALELLPHGERRGPLLRGLADSLAAAGRLEDAREALLEAGEGGLALARVERALGRFDAAFAHLQAALARAESGRDGGAVAADVVAADEAAGDDAAGDVIADDDAAGGDAGRARLAVELAVTALYALREDHGVFAREVAALPPDVPPAVRAAGKAAAAVSAFYSGDAATGRRVLREGLALAEDDALAGDLDLGLHLGTACRVLELLPEADALLARATAIARATGRDQQLGPLRTLHATVRRDRGAVDECAAMCEESEDAARLLDQPRELFAALGRRVIACDLQGELSLARRLAAECEALASTLPDSFTAEGRGAIAAIELHADPAGCLERMLEVGGPELERMDAGWSTWLLLIAVRAALAAGAQHEAERLAAVLHARAERLDLPLARSRAALAAAELALARGADGSAGARLAVALAESAGAGLYATDARLVLGRALDGAEAREVLQRAFDDADRGGAGRLRADAGRQLRRLGRRPPAAAGALSAREREIVALAAAGTSNKQIAAALHLSAKTVEYHLSRAYAKLGVRSRVELAAALSASASPSPSLPGR